MTILIGKELKQSKATSNIYSILHFTETLEDSNSEGERAFSEVYKGSTNIPIGSEVRLNYRKNGNYINLISIEEV